MEPLSKESLRRLGLDARKAFVATISDAERTLLEQRLAQNLTSLCAEAKVVGGYAPLGSEISPLLAMEEARAVGRIVAFPAFDHPAKPFRFRAGDPLDAGPFGIMQPKRRTPVVEAGRRRLGLAATGRDHPFRRVGHPARRIRFARGSRTLRALTSGANATAREIRAGKVT